MKVESPETPSEVKSLKACISDLLVVVALPAIWTGAEPSRMVRTLLDVLLRTLRLDLVHVRLKAGGDAPFEMTRVAGSPGLTVQPQLVAEALERCVGDDPETWTSISRCPIGDADITIAPLPLGVQGSVGVLVAGSRRPDFPRQTERLLLSVAANQATIGVQEARLRLEQQRMSRELERRVGQRTAELAAANEELRREIAERRLAEERLRLEERELKRSEALLAEAQRLSSTGSFTWRVDTDEITWSEQSYRLFQIDRATPLTFELMVDRVHPEDLPGFKERLGRARSGGGGGDFEFRLRLPDRQVRYMHVVSRGTRDADGRLEYIGTVQDVTERKLSEEALGKVRSELAHVARVSGLGVLTASIAHEVNQPLSGIITNASTCLRMLAADPPNVDGALETARRTIRDGHRASDVIARLRALFGKKAAAAESVDLNEATREVIALCLSELHRSRAILRTELADDLPPVTGDRVQLQQVILNLLRNASDAMIGVDDRPRHLMITTGLDEQDQVRVTVQDTGAGFEPQGVNRLFEAFYTTKSDGMGIGLSVSRSIIESHDGRLWAAPNDGPGATFSFAIPRRRESATAPCPFPD